MAYTFNEDVFVIDCWTDTEEKENILKQLLIKLKNYGFRTFGSIIDESYDLEDLHSNRLLKIFKVIDHIDSMSINELRDMYDQMKGLVEYNYNLLCEKTPQISNLIEENVFPTYCYTREYITGKELKVHKDRQACEISLTVNLDADKLWDFWIITPKREKKNIKMNPGDAVLYKGITSFHWRDPYDGRFCIQMFLHYVKSNGENAHRFFDRDNNLYKMPGWWAVPPSQWNITF